MAARASCCCCILPLRTALLQHFDFDCEDTSGCVCVRRVHRYSIAQSSVLDAVTYDACVGVRRSIIFRTRPKDSLLQPCKCNQSNWNRRRLSHSFDDGTLYVINAAAIISRASLRLSFCRRKSCLILRPYPGIAPGGYSIHYTNTDPNLFPGANPG